MHKSLAHIQSLNDGTWKIIQKICYNFCSKITILFRNIRTDLVYMVSPLTLLTKLSVVSSVTYICNLLIRASSNFDMVGFLHAIREISVRYNYKYPLKEMLKKKLGQGIMFLQLPKGLKWLRNRYPFVKIIVDNKKVEACAFNFCWLFPPDSFIIVPFEHFR